MASIFNAYVAYQFIKTLTTKWSDMEAYDLGIVDENGKQLKKTRDLDTQKERNAYTVFHRVTFNLKRVLEKFPFGRSRIASYAAALALLRENQEFKQYTSSNWRYSFLVIVSLRVAKVGELN